MKNFEKGQGLRLSPAHQFAVYSLIILLLLGGVLVWLLSDHIERQTAVAIADTVGHQVSAMIRVQLSAADLREPMTGERYQAFDAFLRRSILSRQVARVKVWNKEGRIIYADDPALVGRLFPLEDELREVFEQDKVTAKLASQQKAENVAEQGIGQLLEIYVPLVPNDSDETLGTYEVYLYYDPIAASVRHTQTWIGATVTVALAALWGSLYWIFARASRVIERAEAERKWAAHLALLNEIAAQAASTLDADELLQRAADAVRRRFEYYTVSVLLLDDQTGELVPRAVAGLPSGILFQDIRLKVGQGIMGHVAETGQSYLAGDVTRDPYYVHMPGLETRAELCVPLRRDGGVIGVLNIESSKKDALHLNDVTAMETLSDQLAVALTNARLYEETKRLSILDGLTGAYNRRCFDQRLAEEVRRARRYNHPLSLVMIDIDYFKAYNDTHGHPRGDEVLRQLANLMRASVRETDLVARYGGEEFVILLLETFASAALEVAEKIRAEVAAHGFLGEETQPGGDLTISVGVATFLESTARPLAEATESAALVSCADEALYHAKSLGRNRVCGAVTED